MKLKTLLAVAVAAAFAVPLAAQASADSDTIILAQAGAPSGASSTGTAPSGGTPSPQTSGEPKAPAGGMSDRRAATGASTMDRSPDFSAVDKNGDGQISRAEWDAHFRSGSAASGGATVAPVAPAGSVVTPGGSGVTGSTAGPDAASNKTAPSSDTATSPSTSGQGKAK
jgi:hypothetical protein